VSPALPQSDEELWALAMSDNTDPEMRARYLAYRVSILAREKEDLEIRLSKIENAYTMGRGIFWALPFVGMILGAIFANWGWITKPWLTTRP
jgi:hypothetical protein